MTLLALPSKYKHALAFPNDYDQSYCNKNNHQQNCDEKISTSSVDNVHINSM